MEIALNLSIPARLTTPSPRRPFLWPCSPAPRKMIKRLGPTEPPAPQFYRVECGEGHVLRGPRTEGYQAIRCPGCGEGLFVLPRSPLPEPPSPPSEKARKRPSQDADEPIQWVEVPNQALQPPDPTGVDFYEDTVAPSLEADPPALEAPSQPEPPRPKQPRKAAASAGPTPEARPAKTRRRSRSAPTAPVAAIPGQIFVPDRPPLAVRLWRYRHLLMLTGVLMLVTATIAYRSYRTWWENLPKVAAEARAEGVEALSSGAFDLAKQQLAIAADALERLDDPDAPPVRQAASEAAIFADLANRSLEELVEEVALRPDTGTDDSPLTQKDRSLLIASRVAALPRDDRGYDLEYRVFSGGKMGRLDLSGFKLFEGLSLKVGDSVTFGGRLESIRLGSDNLWQVRLAPESGVFLTTPEGWQAARSLGWPVDDLQKKAARP